MYHLATLALLVDREEGKHYFLSVVLTEWLFFERCIQQCMFSPVSITTSFKWIKL
jgi:hypothetical protein